ncbi:MAG TPA: CARDB domain-containing protein [Afifellaceae bacterium]|nr:CARDB domain-containing protein [Afifellaceae bacterium]
MRHGVRTCLLAIACLATACIAGARPAAADLIVELAGEPATNDRMKAAIVEAVGWTDVGRLVKPPDVKLRIDGKIIDTLRGVGDPEKVAREIKERGPTNGFVTTIHFAPRDQRVGEAVAKYLKVANFKVILDDGMPDAAAGVLVIGDAYDLSLDTPKAWMNADGRTATVDVPVKAGGQRDYSIDIRESGRKREAKLVTRKDWYRSYSIDVPADWQGTTRKLTVVIDPDDEFAETNERNNETSVTLEVPKVALPPPVTGGDEGTGKPIDGVTNREPKTEDGNRTKDSTLIERLLTLAEKHIVEIAVAAGIVLLALLLFGRPRGKRARPPKPSEPVTVTGRLRSCRSAQSVEARGRGLALPSIGFRAGLRRGEAAMAFHEEESGGG